MAILSLKRCGCRRSNSDWSEKLRLVCDKQGSGISAGGQLAPDLEKRRGVASRGVCAQSRKVEKLMAAGESLNERAVRVA